MAINAGLQARLKAKRSGQGMTQSHVCMDKKQSAALRARFPGPRRDIDWNAAVTAALNPAPGQSPDNDDQRDAMRAELGAALDILARAEMSIRQSVVGGKTATILPTVSAHLASCKALLINAMRWVSAED